MEMEMAMEDDIGDYDFRSSSTLGQEEFDDFSPELVHYQRHSRSSARRYSDGPFVLTASRNDPSELSIDEDDEDEQAASGPSFDSDGSSANSLSSSMDTPSTSQNSSSHPASSHSSQPLTSSSLQSPHHAGAANPPFDEFIEDVFDEMEEMDEIDFDDEPIQPSHRTGPLLFDRRNSTWPNGAPPPRRPLHRARSVRDQLVGVEVGRRSLQRRINQASRSRSPPSLSSRQPTVIDLTDEPDDPPVFRQPFPRPPHRSHIPSQVSQLSQDSQHSQFSNPRRHGGFNRRTPSLTRSDGSLLGGFGGSAPVIDLTADSPEMSEAPLPPRRVRWSGQAPEADNSGPRLPRAFANANGRAIGEHLDAGNGGGRAEGNGGGGGGGGPDIAFLGIFRHFAGHGEQNGIARAFHRTFQGLNFGRNRVDVGVEVQVIGHNPIVHNPLAEHPVQLNYQANGLHHRAEPPKPPFEAPPAPRPGFTRDTGADLAVICPSCEEELSYDPDEAAEDGPPAKKPRTRKDREEHHFWAVKACGHVFCKRCYAGRKELAKKEVPGSFRLDPIPRKNRKVFCAVEDCESDVTTTTAWVGIFL